MHTKYASHCIYIHIRLIVFTITVKYTSHSVALTYVRTYMYREKNVQYVLECFSRTYTCRKIPVVISP